MASHYPDLGSASDWLKQISRAAQPIRRTTKIWVVKRHQYGISALVSQTSFREEASGGSAKSRLFSEVMFLSPPKSCDSWRVVGLSRLPRSSRLKYLPFLQSVFLVASCWPQFVVSYWMLVLSPAPVVNLSTAVEQRWCCFQVSCAMTFHHRRSANKTEKVTENVKHWTLNPFPLLKINAWTLVTRWCYFELLFKWLSLLIMLLKQGWLRNTKAKTSWPANATVFPRQ